jgi:peptidoglycan hydrolase-like protein with peptidoglycan-binding domain
MADPWVEEVQLWLNATYTGVASWDPVPVTGRTGWTTMYALTKALQHELGITALSNNFGAGTLAALAPLGNIGPTTVHANISNINKIIVGGLYCKGYNGGNGALTGSYSALTVTAVQQLAIDVGLTSSDGRLFPKLFKALLTMDAFVRLPGGSAELRAAQQWLNRTYYGRSSFQFGPSDGLGSRGVLKSLLYGVQYEVGLSDAIANGVFGPSTQTKLEAQGQVAVDDTDSTKNFVKLFTTALLLNQQAVTFSDTFSSTLESLVAEFQAFSALSVNGEGNFQTWASLLSSKGDPNRPATACDTATPLTADSAAGLHAAGYRAVGRYLVTAGSNPDWKVLQPGELQTIFAAGLSVFPIFQLTGTTASYFTESRGFADGQAAVAAATGFAILSGATIYFAVDFDAQDTDIASNVIPYFRGVTRGMRAGTGRAFRVGVYGTRNVCTRVSEAFGLQHSFVSDMSTGYSGNMGFALPVNWAIDQIATVTVPYAGGSIEIDRNVWYQSDTDLHYGGIDPGIDSISQPIDVNQDFITWVTYLESKAANYRLLNPSAPSVRDLTIQYLRVMDGNYRDVRFDQIAGGDDDDWINYVLDTMADDGTTAVFRVKDPWTGASITVDHLAYTIMAVVLRGQPAAPNPNRGDIGGWGGDLITALRDYLGDNRGYTNARDYAAAMVGTSIYGRTFNQDDLLADVDGYNIAMAMRDDPDLKVSVAFARAYTGNMGPAFTRNRIADFHDARFGSPSALAERGYELFRYTGDPVMSGIRQGLMGSELIGLVPDSTINSFVTGFGDVLARLR